MATRWALPVLSLVARTCVWVCVVHSCYEAPLLYCKTPGHDSQSDDSSSLSLSTRHKLDMLGLLPLTATQHATLHKLPQHVPGFASCSSSQRLCLLLLLLLISPFFPFLFLFSSSLSLLLFFCRCAFAVCSATALRRCAEREPRAQRGG